MSDAGAWRPMREDDVGAVAAISDTVHGAYTERAAVFAERLSLYPAGCFLLEMDGRPVGYCISHPWRDGQSPALNHPIGAIPADADCYYLHDLALLPMARGSGASATAVERVVGQARLAGYRRIALVAVHGAERFWRQHGFVDVVGAGPYGAGSVFMRRPVGEAGLA